mmetsp:Transcript_12882/g.32981  ORF Transcript_12882/g.32981 Transcript_12882/m.32981 type:complete len:128 (+) Transcript_12882:60-443(+)
MSGSRKHSATPSTRNEQDAMTCKLSSLSNAQQLAMIFGHDECIDMSCDMPAIGTFAALTFPVSRDVERLSRSPRRLSPRGVSSLSNERWNMNTPPLALAARPHTPPGAPMRPRAHALRRTISPLKTS